MGAAWETLGRKSGSWSRTSLLRWVTRVARRVAGVMPWVSWVALLSRIAAGVTRVTPAIRGSWRALSSIAWSSLVAREAGIAWMLPCRSSSVGTPCSWWSSLSWRRSSPSPSLVIARKPLTSIL